MKDDEAFNAVFVSVVKKHEILYNNKLDEYSFRDLKEKAWQEVASEVKCTVKECKKRWRMLRNCLLRSLRESRKSRAGTGKKAKPYYLENAMKYLIPFLKSRHQTGIADSDEDEVHDSDYQMVEIQTVIDEEDLNISEKNFEESKSKIFNKISTSELVESYPASFVISEFSEESPHGSSSKKPKIQKNTENSCLSAFSNKCNTRKEDSTDQEDADLLFLRSLLPDLKQLNDAKKRRFKQRVFTLFDDILNEDST